MDGHQTSAETPVGPVGEAAASDQNTKSSLKPPSDTQSVKAAGSKTGSTKENKRAPSSRASARSILLEQQMKLIEEEKKLKEQELKEQAELEKQLLEEEHRHLEEKKKLVEEERLLRQRKLEAEKERLAKKQSIRRETMEKKNEVIKLTSEDGSTRCSLADSQEKVEDWLEKQKAFESSGEKTLMGPHMTNCGAKGHQSNTVSQDPKQPIGEADVLSKTNNASFTQANASTIRFSAPILHHRQSASELGVNRSSLGNQLALPSFGHPTTNANELLRRRNIHQNLKSGISSHPNPQQVPSRVVRELFRPTIAHSKPILQTHQPPPPIHPYIQPPVPNIGLAPSINHLLLPGNLTVPHFPLSHFCYGPPETVERVQHQTFSSDGMPRNTQTLPTEQPGCRHDSGQGTQTVEPTNSTATTNRPGLLSSQQIAARQVVGKDLPSFNGDPTDWPMFISSFEQSTAACGYSHAENLVRLQRCLTGHARESVRSKLLLPSSVPHVIQTLRTLFGRPELLLKSMLDKVRRTPGPQQHRLETVIQFGLAIQNFVDHLEAAEQTEHLSNPMLMQELVEKLPGPMRMEWAHFKGQHVFVNLATFGEFMRIQVNAASEVSFELPNSFHRNEKTRPKEKVGVQTHSTESNVGVKPSDSAGARKINKACRSCEQEGHKVADCPQFKTLSADERWKLIQSKGLCRTCLNSHGKWPCKSWEGCGIPGCRMKHHTLLHSSSSSVNVSSHFSSNEMQPLFRILPVVLYAEGKSVAIFAFIDEGSQITLLEEKVAKQLGLEGPTRPLTLQWTGNVKRNEPKSQQIQVEISGKHSKTRYDLKHARTVSCLLLPSQQLKYGELAERFPHLRGLPVEDYDLVQPKLLIGLDNLRLGVPLKHREGGPNDPVAVKCRLGWGIYGSTSGRSEQPVTLNFHVAVAPNADHELNEQLRDYFALEDTGVAGLYEKPDSEEEKRAKRMLEETTKRTSSGFETGLLWKTDNPDFPDSYSMAIRRLHSLESKLQKDPVMKQRVSEQIKEYERKGYAHKASEEEVVAADNKRVWYLPLGIVINPKKPGKIRLIWDAAAKAGGVSFNSKLLKGPDLLTPLPKVLSRFRQFPVAICGDIKEMFHQIHIREVDRQSQRFLWRDNPDERPSVYVMDVATFGSTCSPASAQYIKNLNAKEFSDTYPRAAAAIVESHYVDDYLDSFKTVEEAVEVVNEVKLVHSKGGFEIRNFISNEEAVLQGIGTISTEGTKQLVLTRGDTSESVLGMKWLPKEDAFTYTFAMRDDLQPILTENHIPTKREVLKVVMSLFDPLGFVAFFLVHGKILIQDIWASGTDWDEPIKENLRERWYHWTKFFTLLDTLRIPRCYFRSPPAENLDELELHVFVDASESAYSCVAYFRLPSSDGVQVALVSAKTKVAPLKTLSIPRLELKAAVLGIRLADSIQNFHTFSISKRFFWSDSSTVLAWIASDHRRYHKFVACRIGEILTHSDPKDWKWVPSKLNVADEATKWSSSGPKFSPNSPWFQGPAFLKRNQEDWPQQRAIKTTQEEMRGCHSQWVPVELVDISRFQRWTKLQRTVAYVFRYVDNLRRKMNGSGLELGVLRQDELKRAEELLWKSAQAECFPEEVAILTKTQGSPHGQHACIPKSSPIYKNWPFLDEQGVLRMRSRLEAAPFVSYEAKYPAILPKQHAISFLVADWFHRRFRHANRETVINEMRQRYEISKLRALLDKVSRACLFCRNKRSLPKPPPMAPLPPARLQPFVRAFTHVGLDYFGPVFVRFGRCVVKRWVALFTCLTIRAVHIEVVYRLTTDSCIMAVRRFVARRGPPAEFYTDNGTYFHGASNVLQQEIAARNDALALTFTSAQTRWNFIPPAAPHMGGAWERLVRSVKVAVGSILEAPRKPDDETLETILLEAEAMINSRPLTYIPLEGADQEALTPNHFLLGNSNGTKILPTEPVNHHSVLRSSWKLAQHIMDDFWRRWVKEYLPVIARRSKWFEESRELKVGDLVLVVDGTVRNRWIRGRVEKVVPGRDGRVRQAVLRTASGVIKRPAVKLALLDVADI